MPWGLLVGVSRGWRRVLGIADTAFVWVAPCLAKCWWACRVGGAVSWGLPTRASSGWRVFGIARRSGEPKRLILKGRACTESSFLGFGLGTGVREVQNGSFLKAALVQNRHFWALGRVRAFERPGSAESSFLSLWHWSLRVRSCHVTSRRVTSHHDMSCHVMSCHVMSCHVMSCHVTSRHVMSCCVAS